MLSAFLKKPLPVASDSSFKKPVQIDLSDSSFSQSLKELALIKKGKVPVELEIVFPAKKNTTTKDVPLDLMEALKEIFELQLVSSLKLPETFFNSFSFHSEELRPSIDSSRQISKLDMSACPDINKKTYENKGILLWVSNLLNKNSNITEVIPFLENVQIKSLLKRNQCLQALFANIAILTPTEFADSFEQLKKLQAEATQISDSYLTFQELIGLFYDLAGNGFLHAAVKAKNVTLTHWLIHEKGVPFDIPNFQGLTSMDVVKQCLYAAQSTLLLKKDIQAYQSIKNMITACSPKKQPPIATNTPSLLSLISKMETMNRRLNDLEEENGYLRQAFKHKTLTITDILPVLPAYSNTHPSHVIVRQLEVLNTQFNDHFKVYLSGQKRSINREIDELKSFQQNLETEKKQLLLALENEERSLVQNPDQTANKTQLTAIQQQLQALESALQPILAERRKKEAILKQRKALLTEDPRIAIYYQTLIRQLESLFMAFKLWQSELVEFNHGVLPQGQAMTQVAEAVAIGEKALGITSTFLSTLQKVSDPAGKVAKLAKPLADAALTASNFAKPLTDAIPIAGAVIGMMSKGVELMVKAQEKSILKKLGKQMTLIQENDFAECLARVFAHSIRQQLLCLKAPSTAEELGYYTVDRIILVIQALEQTLSYDSLEDAEVLAQHILQKSFELKLKQGKRTIQASLGFFQPSFTLPFCKGYLPVAWPGDGQWQTDALFRKSGYCVKTAEHPLTYDYYSQIGNDESTIYGYKEVVSVEGILNLQQDASSKGPASKFHNSSLSLPMGETSTITSPHNQQLLYITTTQHAQREQQELNNKMVTVAHNQLSDQAQELVEEKQKRQQLEERVKALEKSVFFTPIPPTNQLNSRPALSLPRNAMT